jgi:hypothetical protein
MKKKRLSVAEHQALGQRLLALRDELSAIGQLLGKAYPVQLGDRWHRASERLLEVRSPLEDDMISAMKAEGVDDGKVPKCYYSRAGYHGASMGTAAANND